MADRIWFQTEPFFNEYEERIGEQHDTLTDGFVYLEYYLADVELGTRVFDYLYGTGEDEILSDLKHNCLFVRDTGGWKVYEYGVDGRRTLTADTTN